MIGITTPTCVGLTSRMLHNWSARSVIIQNGEMMADDAYQAVIGTVIQLASGWECNKHYLTTPILEIMTGKAVQQMWTRLI